MVFSQWEYIEYIIYTTKRINILYIRNIVDISGALFILTIQFQYTQTQYKEGARDVINVKVCE